jgi:hypothetical protein
LFHGQERLLARRGGRLHSLLECRELRDELGKAVGAKEPLGRRRSASSRHEAVPSPELAFAGDEPLTNCKGLAIIDIHDRDLPQPAKQFPGRGCMVGKTLRARGQRRVRR